MRKLKKGRLSKPVTQLVSKGPVFDAKKSVSMCKCVYQKGKRTPTNKLIFTRT